MNWKTPALAGMAALCAPALGMAHHSVESTFCTLNRNASDGSGVNNVRLPADTAGR